MSFTRAYAIVLRYLFLLRNSPQRVFHILVWAVMDIVVWGFLTIYLDELGGATFSFVPVLLGAVLLWAFLIRAQQGVSTTALEDIWTRNLLNFFGSPLRVGEYTAGLVLTSIVVSAVGIAALFSLALLFFSFSILDFGIMLVPFLAILFLFGIALGIIGAAVVIRYGPSAEWFVWPLPALLAPFCGVLYPISILPAWMQWISQILAPTYVFKGMRAAILNGTFDLGGLAIGLVLGVGSVALASLLFARIFRQSLRSGAFARYSAENVL